MLKKLLLITSAAALALAPAAYADTITDTGSTYTLSYTSAGSNLYDVTLVINTSAFSGQGTALGEVELKLAPNNSDYTSLSVLQEPSGYSGSLQTCNGGFLCLDYTGSGLGVPVGSSGDTYTYVFQIGVKSGDLLTGADDASVKADYFYYKGDTVKNGGIASDSITLSPGATTPEPSSLALLGTSVLGAAGLLRRRFKA